jgi:hypothetical protein
MITKPGGRHMVWLARLCALVAGLALMFGGINFAAEIGDILFAVPMMFLGGLQILYAATGSYPRRWRVALCRGAPPNER